MKRKLYVVLAAVTLLVALPLLATNETINYDDINKIKAEGMQRSQVMELNSWLSDVYAPRLTGSPTIEKAAEWAMGKMKEWGLVNVKMEPWTEPATAVRSAVGPTTSFICRRYRRRSSRFRARRPPGPPVPTGS